MATNPYLGDIMLWPASFAPRGWAFCAGQEFSINQNQALFALIGAQYGGNGQTTFALPDLRGRSIMGIDPASGVVLGQQGGSATIAVTGIEVTPDSGPPVAQAADFDNRPEYLALNYVIALQGVFPNAN